MDEKESILIVDDDENTCRTLELIFGKKGYETETVGTGREVIEKVRRRFFNVVLLDLKLPDVEGIELLAPLKMMHLDMAVILITGHASIETAVQAMNEGASSYINKPLNMDEVIVTVKKALEKQHLVIEKRQADEKLKKTTNDLKQTVEKLKKANHKIREQQKSVIDEERLKVLLQMAGATAHELNQPLMVLLCAIELMGMNKDNHEKLTCHMADIEEAGQRISDIVKKIQTIRHDETKPYDDTTSIINLEQEINILSVNNSADDFEMINTILKNNTQTVHVRANSIKNGMESLENGDFDIVLLDHVLPDGNSFDFLRVMGEKKLEIPVVVITGKGDELVASKVSRAGTYDYLSKHQVNEEHLYRSINNAMEKYRLKREIKRSTEKMGEMETRDELTGLYNRRYFMEALEREVSRARRYETDLGLCTIELDHFKQINDTYGYPAGDMVLSDISKMLLKYIRQSDLVCRYGGEEFAVIFPNTQPEKARLVCERFKELVTGHQFKYNASQFHITVSVGAMSYDKPRGNLITAWAAHPA